MNDKKIIEFPKNDAYLDDNKIVVTVREMAWILAGTAAKTVGIHGDEFDEWIEDRWEAYLSTAKTLYEEIKHE
jgi:hypothetical protein